jgi:glycosyltransferase involved in cell wall biosynthesis
VRLLIFNLAMDVDDPVLGFTSGWVRALAARCDAVDVITMRAGRVDLPANVRVHSAGKEHGRGVPRRVAEFYRLLLRVMRTARPQACFSHMMPAFTVMGGPLLSAAGIPIVTWYAHPSLTATLKLAHRFSRRMVTSLPGAYPYRRDKLLVVGQGIDTDAFRPGDGGEEEGEPLLLCAGRLSPVKDHHTLIEAAARLHAAGVSFRLAVVGGPAIARDEEYVRGLRSLARQRGLDGRVDFAGAVAPAGLVAWYRRCAAHVNLTPAGFGDKVALEAMSCARPSLAANDDLRETMGAHARRLWFPKGDAGALAENLGEVLSLGRDERARMGRDLRASVVERHGLSRLASRLITLLADEATSRGVDGRH